MDIITKIASRTGETLSENSIENKHIKKILANIARRKNISDSENNLKRIAEDIFTYMTKIFIHNFLWFIALFILSSLFKIKLATITFILVYIPLRRSFGGVHLKNEYICLIISIIIPVLLGNLAYKISFSSIILGMIYVFAYVMAIFVGVVDNQNKRLSAEQKKRFKKEGIIILTAIMVIHIFLINNIVVSNSIAMAVFLGFANLYIKNH